MPDDLLWLRAQTRKLQSDVDELRRVINVGVVGGTVDIPRLVQGVPVAGDTGAILQKYAGADYAAAWIAPNFASIGLLTAVTQTIKVLGSSIGGLSPVTTTLAALAGHTHSMPLTLGAVQFVVAGNNTSGKYGPQSEVRIPFGLNVLGVEAIAISSKNFGCELWLAPSFFSRPAMVGNKVTASSPIAVSNTLGYRDVALSGWTTSWPPGSYIMPVSISAEPGAFEFDVFIWGQQHTN